MRDTPDDPLELLGEVPAFAGLSDDVLRRLAAAGSPLSAPASTPLFEQGARPAHLHVLLRGQVGLTGASAAGTTTIVEVLRPVDQFVLAAVLTDAPYLMGARALADSALWLIEAAALRAVVREAPELATVMMTSLARHYRMLVRQVKDLKLRSTAQRLGCFLLEQSREQAVGRLRLPYDKQLLAARLGTTPENLSRAFATLRRYGVRTSGALVELADPAALALYAGPDEPHEI